MNPYAGTVRALGRTKPFSWVASRVLPPLDRRFVGRRRAPSSLGTGFPLCYLVARSRKTGEPRTVPLLHVADGARVVLIASNWGRRKDPAWAFDLEAHPNASVVVSGVERAYRARRATPDEAGRYWERALAVWPGYGDYRRRAGREIRMFVLEPCSEWAPETDGGHASSRRRLGAVVALLCAGAVLATWWAVHRRGEPESLGALLERVVRQGAPGALVVVVDDVGRRTVEARGTADRKTALPMGEGVRFRVGSVTKTFVAALVLRLVEEGKLGLDDSVTRWAPELVPRRGAITVRQLLSHTSGLPDYVDDPRIRSNPERRWRPVELVSMATSREEPEVAGRRFSYASTNYVVLGVVAERAGGARLGRLLATRLFGPLALRHTSYEPGTIAGDNVVGHRPPSHQGVVTGAPVEVPETAWWAGPAGAIVSTAGDVERFLVALLGGQVVRPESLREMEKLVPAGRNRYGLGIAVFPTPCGPAWGHTGNVQGTVTVAWATRDAGRRVVLVVNAYPLSPELEDAVRRVQVAAFCGEV